MSTAARTATPLARRILASPSMVYIYVVLAILTIWVVLSSLGSVPPVLLPTLGETLQQLAAIVSDPETLFANVGATAAEVTLAFAFAAVAGVALGVVVGSRTDYSRAYEPLLANLNAIPIVLLYPLLLGAMGSGGEAKVVIGAISAGLPIAIATHWVVRGVDRDLVVAARSMGARRLSTVRSVTLPAVLPGVFSGLRTGLSLAIVTVVAGEFLSATVGLGLQLARAGESFQTAALFAWLIVTAVFTAVMIGLLSVIQTLVIRKVNA